MVCGQYVAGTACGRYVPSKWMVCGWYVVGMWLVFTGFTLLDATALVQSIRMS